MGKKVNWVLDADIRGFFDTIDHEWLLKFLEHRIADRRILRLIRKWLRAGVSEDGQWSKTKVGTPQGAVISPLLGECVPALRFRPLGTAVADKDAPTGEVIVVRYADDFVVGFQHRHDAERFLRELRERLREVRPGLAPRQDAADRVRAVRCPESAAAWSGQAGDVRLSGLHPRLWAEAPDGRFLVRRKTVSKRLRAKLQAVKATLLGASSSRLGARRVVARSGAGVFQLPRHSRQSGRPGDVSHAGQSLLAARRCGAAVSASADVGTLRATH